MIKSNLYHTIKRYVTLHTHYISAMPLVILMPHSSCNCRCIMCDIWKGNNSKNELSVDKISELVFALKSLGTRQVLLSGGEALLHSGIFQFCSILKSAGMKITLLSTGITVAKNAVEIVKWTDNLIVSLDGDEDLHDRSRNIKGAFKRLEEGIRAVRKVNPLYKITGRCVIHKMNYASWKNIVHAAKYLQLNSISFLPADVSSQAFNRHLPWEKKRQDELLVPVNELKLLHAVIEDLVHTCSNDFQSGFILESPDKIRQILEYYAAAQGLNEFPLKKCNAPWVSAVVEADGEVKPCFFHSSMGNVNQTSFAKIINNEKAMAFRRNLDMNKDETCRRCVCSLSLPAYKNPGR